jgi:transcriptional regulator with XRE-family HTH domain
MNHSIQTWGTDLAGRLREVREARGESQERAAAAISVSQPTYFRIEDGTRPLKADELILLADLFDIRAAALTGMAEVRSRARLAARVEGDATCGFKLRDRLYAYLEVDGYLRNAGITDDDQDVGVPS